MRRSFAFGLWLAVTLTATAIVWTAVGVVAADVTDRPAPVVAHRDVVVALADSSPVPPTARTTTTTVKPVPTSPPAAARATTVAPRSSTTLPPFAPFVPGVTTTKVPPTTIKPVVVPPPTTQPPTPTTSYSTRGGVVTVACTSPFTVRLVSATPNDGFLVIVANAGPGQVEVNFLSRSQALKVSAVCFFGKPVKTTWP